MDRSAGPGVSARLALAVLAALALTGCGRLGHDASAIFAAHNVLRRELPQFQIEFTESHIVARERPYYMVEITALLSDGDEDETDPRRTVRRSFLIVLALNPRNGVQFRWHPGVAVARLDGAEPDRAVIAGMKRRNRWGSPVDWARPVRG